MSTPNKSFNRPWIKFTITLSVTLVSSIMVFWGIAIAIYSAFVSYGGNRERANWLVILGLILVISGNFLLGLFFNSGRRGWISGFVAPFAGMAGWAFAGSGISYSLSELSPSLMWILGFGITATAMIITLVIISGKVQTYPGFVGLALGILVGILLPFWLLRITRESDLFPTITFIWMWLSAVFFTELYSKRVSLGETLIWLVFMCASPFLVFEILKTFALIENNPPPTWLFP